jgi:hypothetical protein
MVMEHLTLRIGTMERQMFKVAVVSNFSQEVVDLPGVPRVGDTIPLFWTPAPKVTHVCWMPEKMMPEIAGKGIDVVITVE